MGLRILTDMVYDYDHVQVTRDSHLVMQQITREYKCLNPNLQRSRETTNKLLRMFVNAIVLNILREENVKPITYPRQAYGYKEIPNEILHEENMMKECVQMDDSLI